MWWSCFDYYNQEHIHNRTIKRLRLRDHLQKDRSQKTAHICYTLIDKRLIDKSVYNRFTIYQVDPQREPAPKTEHHRTTLGRRHCSARSGRIWRSYKKLFCQSDRNQMRKNWRQWDALPWRWFGVNGQGGARFFPQNEGKTFLFFQSV